MRIEGLSRDDQVAVLRMIEAMADRSKRKIIGMDYDCLAWMKETRVSRRGVI